jgi:hypothetical protein
MPEQNGGVVNERAIVYVPLAVYDAVAVGFPMAVKVCPFPKLHEYVVKLVVGFGYPVNFTTPFGE